ncbi:MAG: YfhL family 4Fe-4S dicluster ferredoxin [Deltaproteobacteria bacterium]|nr:YfhL family 4Fe-4S dicluster ferredoxin [Deltaproteobacteria bacterium]
MAYKINEECIMCGTCEEECPNEAIAEGEESYIIDPAKCTECVGFYESPRCAINCTVEACVPDPDHQETRDELLEKWKQLHSGGIPAGI